MGESDGSSNELDLNQFIKNVKNTEKKDEKVKVKDEEENTGMLGKLFDTYSYMTS